MGEDFSQKLLKSIQIANEANLKVKLTLAQGLIRKQCPQLLLLVLARLRFLREIVWANSIFG